MSNLEVSGHISTSISDCPLLKIQVQPHVGQLVREIHARYAEVEVTHVKVGVQHQVLVVRAAMTQLYVIKAYLPFLARCGVLVGRRVGLREFLDDVGKVEHRVTLRHFYIRAIQMYVSDIDLVRQQVPDFQLNIEGIEGDKVPFPVGLLSC